MKRLVIGLAALTFLSTPAFAQDRDTDAAVDDTAQSVEQAADAVGDMLDESAEGADEAVDTAVEDVLEESEAAEAEAVSAPTGSGTAQIGTGDGEAAVDEATDTDNSGSSENTAQNAEPVATPPAPAATGGEQGASRRPTPPPPGATGGNSGVPQWQRITEAELNEPNESYPWLEWHGYFRFRADSFWNLDLGTTGTSPILPPAEALVNANTRTGGEWADIPPTDDIGGEVVDFGRYVKDGANHIGGANLRFRLRPIFHVMERARIHLEMNILDNLVMGSTPDGFNEIDGVGGRGDVPIVAFSGGQEPPTLASVGQNSINVTQAYGEATAFFGRLRLGRMADNFGLGIMANGGGDYTSLRERRLSFRGLGQSGHTCLDCDYGDYVDRAELRTRLFNHYITLAFDYAYNGPTNGDPVNSFGQPRDVSQFDDVRSYVFQIERRPMDEREIGERNRRLNELRIPAFDYGARLNYRTQRISAEQCEEELDAASCVFVPRGAKAFMTSLWARLQHSPGFRRHLRIELELAGVFGKIENVVNGLDNEDRTMRQFGGALEVDYSDFELGTGFNAGFATGRDNSDGDATPGFGVQDRFLPLVDEGTITAFQFDRNYMVDHIMFREIIGTITNAWYINPYFQYDLFSKFNDVLGARLDVIAAGALVPGVTPSGNGFYGVELDFGAYYRQPRFSADLSFGVFLPGNAFNGVRGRSRLSSVTEYYGNSVFDQYAEDVRAKASATLQGRFFWTF